MTQMRTRGADPSRAAHLAEAAAREQAAVLLAERSPERARVHRQRAADLRAHATSGSLAR